MENGEKQCPVGQMLRGQAWVELHGIFTAKQLHSIAEEMEKKCRGLEKKDGDSRGCND